MSAATTCPHPHLCAGTRSHRVGSLAALACASRAHPGTRAAAAAPPAPGGHHVWVMGADTSMVRLRTGVLGLAARRVYSTGQCHSLALALHQRLGAGMAVVRDPDGDLLHVVAGSGEPGLYLDVSGEAGAEDLLERYSGGDVEWEGTVAACTSADVDAWVGAGVLLAHDVPTAATFVDAVIACEVTDEEDED